MHDEQLALLHQVHIHTLCVLLSCSLIQHISPRLCLHAANTMHDEQLALLHQVHILTLCVLLSVSSYFPSFVLTRSKHNAW